MSAVDQIALEIMALQLAETIQTKTKGGEEKKIHKYTKTNNCEYRSTQLRDHSHNLCRKFLSTVLVFKIRTKLLLIRVYSSSLANPRWFIYSNKKVHRLHQWLTLCSNATTNLEKKKNNFFIFSKIWNCNFLTFFVCFISKPKYSNLIFCAKSCLTQLK